MVMSSQALKLTQLLAWHGLKMELLCSILLLMIIRDHMEMGSDVEKIIFTENDSKFCVDVTCTKDGKFVTINSNSRTSSEVYVIDAANPFDSLHRVHKRVHGVQYFLEHHHGFFYVLTNHPSVEVKKLHCGNFYLGICRIEDINSAIWQVIL